MAVVIALNTYLEIGFVEIILVVKQDIGVLAFLLLLALVGD